MSMTTAEWMDELIEQVADHGTEVVEIFADCDSTEDKPADITDVKYEDGKIKVTVST
jgi:hypothetical protein